MSQIDEKVISKIRKVLKLAQDNYGNDAESLNIMAKAQRLMVENNISMADVEAFGGKEEQKNQPNAKESTTDYMTSSWWLGRLASIIAKNFRCYIYIYTMDRKKKYVFLGLEDDVTIAKEVFEFAIDIIESYSYLYIQMNKIKGNRTYVNSVKNDYIAGYLDGLRDKFKEQVEREGWGLIIYNKHAVVEEAYNKLSLRKGRSTRVNMGYSSEARKAGYAEGKQFDR